MPLTAPFLPYDLLTQHCNPEKLILHVKALNVTCMRPTSLFTAAQYLRGGVKLCFLCDLRYTVCEVSDVQFKTFVLDKEDWQIPVSIVPMSQTDAETTNALPAWQTSWTSEYLAGDRF